MSELNSFDSNQNTCWAKYTYDMSNSVGTGYFALTVLGLGILNLVTVGGNLLVVLAVATSPKLKTVNGLLITSLAVADLMVGIIVLPFSTSNEAMAGQWIFGELWCQMWLAVDVWMCTASIYNLVAISIDRYLAILKPLTYPTLITIPKARVLVFSVWICSFLICFPPMATHWPEALSSNETRCVCSPMGNSSGYIIYSAVGSFFLPMAIIIFVYIRLYGKARLAVKRLYTGTFKVAGSSSSGESMMMRIHSKPSNSTTPSQTPNSNRKLQSSLMVVPEACTEADMTPIPCAFRKISGGSATGKQGRTPSPRFPKANNRAEIPSISHSPMTRNESVNLEEIYSIKSERNNTTRTKCERKRLKKFSLPVSESPYISERKALLMNGNHMSSDCQRPTSASLQYGKTKDSRTIYGNSRKSSAWSIFLEKSTRKLKERSSTYQSKLSLEIRAAKTVAIVTGCFICCWLGFAVVYTMQATPYCQENVDCVPKTVFSIVFWLGYLNSALNPLIYAVFNKEFRKAFKKLLMCSLCHQPF